MTENFDLEAFRSKAQSVLEHKSLISANDYIVQLENLLHDVQPGSVSRNTQPGMNDLQEYLDRAKSRIESLFYNAPVGYCVLDANGIIVTANKAFIHVLFSDQPTLDGQDLRKYIHPESVELFNFQVKKIIASKTTLSTNLRFYRGEKEITIRFQTTYYAEGEKGFLQCIATDISDTKAIENELATSEAQFRNLLEASPAGILVLYKGKYIYSNKAGSEIFGYKNPDELLGVTAIDTIAEAFKPKMLERMRRLVENSPNELTETEIVCPDGQHKICETVSIPVIFENRVSALIIITDISARKNHEKQLSLSEKNYKEMYQLLRLMCDNVPDMIWAKNLDHQYIFVNKATSEGLLNASDTNEPIGKTESFFVQREHDLHPEDQQWHSFGGTNPDSDTLVLQSNEPLLYTDCGNIYGKYLCLDILKAPFFDSEGNIIGTVGSGRNVTHERWLQNEHDKVVEMLTIQSARLNAVVNVLPDLLFVVDTKGDFLDFFATDPSRLAIDPNQITNLNINNLFPPEEVGRQLGLYKTCIETQSVMSFEYELTTDGSSKLYEARIAPLSKESILAIVRDITDKRQTK